MIAGKGVAVAGKGVGTSEHLPRNNFEVHSENVYEGKQCKRCGIKLMRRFARNPNGTVSCVGWEPYTEETDKE